MKVMVRPARIEEMDAILRVEVSAWAEGQRAAREQWESRIRTFSEGTLVATVGDEVLGLLSTEIIPDYDFDHDSLSWSEVTDHGFIRKSHVKDGKYLYGVDLSVARGAPSSVGQALLIAAIDLTVQGELRGILLGARIPGYHRLASRMSAQDYTFGKTASGRPLDPELCMYSRYGARPIKVIPDYFPDPDSLNNGVLLFWSNPFLTAHRAEMELSLAPLTELFAKTESKFYSSLGKVTCLHLDLPGAGCAWARDTGGCTMCSFSSAARAYSHGRLLRPELFESMYCLGRKSARRKHPKVLTVFNGGSLLNPIEIPPEVQTFLASQVRDDSEIEVLFVESRAEYVTKDNLARIIPQLGSKKLVLGVGLESISEHVRNGNIRKGLPLSVYGSALTTAHAAGAGVRTYVLLKPYGLTDSEAIAETVATVRAAFDMGSDEVSVEAAFVAPGSPLHRSFEDGNYCPPSLWSVVEVIRATTGFGPVYLGQFTDSPPPIAIPDSCPKCSHALRDCLDHYRATLDRATLDGLPDCECRKQIR